jgi:Outer membrane protein beta-barrel domain
MLNRIRCAAVLVFGAAATAEAQDAPQRFTVEARGGLNVPTFDISDAVDGGPSVGAGIGFQVSSSLWLLGDVDLGFHSGAEFAGGAEGPDVKVYHYVAKVGYAVVPEGPSPWSVILNAGGGALTFAVDGGSSNTYPAINVGAKIAYRLSPRVSFLVSPQGDIAFTDEDEIGTSNAWVWPFTAGIRIGI